MAHMYTGPAPSRKKRPIPFKMAYSIANQTETPEVSSYDAED